MSDYKTLPFPLNQAFTKGAEVDYSEHLGKVFTDGKKAYQIVKASGAVTAPNKQTFKWTSHLAYTAEPVAAATDRGFGVSPCEAATLAANDLFYVQINGRCTAIQGDDGTARLTAGQFAQADDDADKGKLKGTATFAFGVTFARVLETATANDQEIQLELLGPLVG